MALKTPTADHDHSKRLIGPIYDFALDPANVASSIEDLFVGDADAVVADAQASRIMTASEAAMDAVADSETAMEAVAASETAMEEVVASEMAMDAVAASETARDAIGTSGMAYDTVAASNMAIGKLVAGHADLDPTDYADMDAVAASDTAMDAVVASGIAMDAVVASQTAIDAVVASETAMEKLSTDAGVSSGSENEVNFQGLEELPNGNGYGFRFDSNDNNSGEAGYVVFSNPSSAGTVLRITGYIIDSDSDTNLVAGSYDSEDVPSDYDVLDDLLSTPDTNSLGSGLHTFEIDAPSSDYIIVGVDRHSGGAGRTVDVLLRIF